MNDNKICSREIVDELLLTEMLGTDIWTFTSTPFSTAPYPIGTIRSPRWEYKMRRTATFGNSVLSRKARRHVILARRHMHKPHSCDTSCTSTMDMGCDTHAMTDLSRLDSRLCLRESMRIQIVLHYTLDQKRS
jgi:hypothetical protein